MSTQVHAPQQPYSSGAAQHCLSLPWFRTRLRRLIAVGGMMLVLLAVAYLGVCAYMALTLLAGLLLNRLFGWWWADPLAALALVYFLVQEGREALHEARTGETCSCGDEDCCDD